MSTVPYSITTEKQRLSKKNEKKKRRKERKKERKKGRKDNPLAPLDEVTEESIKRGHPWRETSNVCSFSEEAKQRDTESWATTKSTICVCTIQH